MAIEILNSQRLEYWGRRLDFPPDAIIALQATASQVVGDAELLPIFVEYHERTLLRGEWHKEWSALPMDERVQVRLGERASQFYLLAYMAALPSTEARYHQLGVSMDIFHDTMKDFLNYLTYYFDLHGCWGYERFPWIWRHLTCELFRLGRLQYMLIPFHGGVTAFRRKPRLQGGALGADGDLPDMDIVLLADPEQALRPDGNAHGIGQSPASDEPPPTGTWKPVYEVSDAGWRGHLIDPYGRAHPKAVFLPRSEWDVILRKGDTVLDLHIPAKDPLTVETCRASFRQALDFFTRVFPHRPWKALFCHTWFFTPQIQTWLPSDSAIVQFQREFYLYPNAGHVDFLWTFVFGVKHRDPRTAPRDTSLRRAEPVWHEQGKEIFDLPGVMFHTPEEWGTQPYMGDWDRRRPPSGAT